MARLAEIYYNTPGIALKVLGPPRNGQQIHTEARLELQLASNDIDVGFFYDCEQSWSNTGNLRFIPLPVEINMSNRTLNPYYAKVNLDFFYHYVRLHFSDFVIGILSQYRQPVLTNIMTHKSLII